MLPVRWTLVFAASICLGSTAPSLDIDPVEWLQKTESELRTLNAECSLRSWLFLASGYRLVQVPHLLGQSLAQWKLNRCREAAGGLPGLGRLGRRAVWLLCRGPMYTRTLERKSNYYLTSLRELYSSSQLCREDSCYHVEPDLARLMQTSREPEQLRWAWEGWRGLLAGPGRTLYPAFVRLQNMAARINGYRDMGEAWREELEMEDLPGEADRLLEEIKPFQRLLHAFVRHRLRQYYGTGYVSQTGPIPAHLLGNMWSQSWESLLDILINSTLDFDTRLQDKYQNVTQLVQEAERYYISIGLQPMSDKFWRNSIITKNDNQNISCHGTAANLYHDDDYRMMMCGDLTWEDFYVIHHEMGHVQYYMAYKELPSFFQEAANSAFQESIGDTIMLAVETPSHLKRLGIIGENEDIEMALLLYQALKKIPHIAFGYIVDKWRWAVMASNVTSEDYNKVWWDYRREIEGLQPPSPRASNMLDPIAKYHIPDNTPYIRYFFSEFIQFQLLEVICDMKNAMYEKEKQDLHLCDLHGFEAAGKKLRILMSHGSMQRWDKTLEEFSGGRYHRLSAKPILNYFKPLIGWLQEKIITENIPIGW